MLERTLNHTIRHGAAVALIFAPLAFGAVEFWSLTLLELLILALGALSLGWRLCSRMPEVDVPDVVQKARGATHATPLAVLMGLFLAYTVLQMVPVPLPWLEKLSSHAWELRHSAREPLAAALGFFSAAALAGEPREVVKQAAQYAPITLNLHATAIEWFKSAVYVVFFWLIIAHFWRGRHFRLMARILIVLGAAIAVLALLQRFGGADKIFWLRQTASKGFMGPFVNENHYAGYMEMSICLGLGYFLFRMEQSAGLHRKKSLRQRLSSIKSPANGLILFSVVLMAVSVLFSLSRGGILTLILSLLNIAYLVALRHIINKRKAPAAARSRNLLVPVLTVCWLTMLFALWLGAEPVVEEMLTLRDVSRQTKLQVMRDTLGIVRDYPLVGTGMGTFPYIYPAYQSFSSHVIFTHAENDYLQMLSEGGAVGFALMAGIIGLVAAVMIRGMLSRKADPRSRRPDNSPIILGCFAALLSMLVHSFFDFNLHIPSNALLFTGILAMGYGLSTLNFREGRIR